MARPKHIRAGDATLSGLFEGRKPKLALRARAQTSAGLGIVSGEGRYPSVCDRRLSCFNEVMLIGGGISGNATLPPVQSRTIKQDRMPVF